MCAVRRLSEIERKNEIMNAAVEAICKKGLEKTTMEDIIAKTTLSKGGVYHYYKNVLEIFRDIMLFGIEYRNEIIKENLKYCKKGYEKQFIAKQMVDKVLDDNPYMPLYVELLRNKKRNPELNKLMIELQEKTRERISSEFSDIIGCSMNIKVFKLLTDFMNSIIMSVDLLDTRESFKEHRELLEHMFLLILENGKDRKNGGL